MYHPMMVPVMPAPPAAQGGAGSSTGSAQRSGQGSGVPLHPAINGAGAPPGYPQGYMMVPMVPAQMGAGGHMQGSTTSSKGAAGGSQSGVVGGGGMGGSFSNTSAASGTRDPSQRREPLPNSNLYVSGLPPEVRDRDIEKLFVSFGKITSGKVMLDVRTGQSRGIAFVKFEELEDATKAKEELDGHVINGATITVKYAEARASYNPGSMTNRVFLRNLPAETTKEKIKEYFSKFGEVVDTGIHVDQNVTPPVCMAHLTFLDVATAQKAVEAVHGTKIFEECKIPVLAKVAEHQEKRNERLKKREKLRQEGESSTNSNLQANSSTSAAAHSASGTAQPTMMAMVPAPHHPGMVMAPMAAAPGGPAGGGGGFVPMHPTMMVPMVPAPAPAPPAGNSNSGMPPK